MGDGPRDWNPPGYWDTPGNPALNGTGAAYQPARSVSKVSNLTGLLSVALGLVAAWWPLAEPAFSTGLRGFAITTAGIMAISLAFRASHLRRIGRASSWLLPAIGGTLGVLGTLLSIWSLAAFYAPGTVPPMPHLTSLTAITQPLASPPSPPSASSVAPPGRIVLPLPGADVTAPTGQLHANLVHVVFALGGALNFTKDHGTLSATLTIASDGMVSMPGTTFSKLPADMRMTYALVAGGRDYSLTITDTQSGTAVGYDSTVGRVVDR